MTASMIFSAQSHCFDDHSNATRGGSKRMKSMQGGMALRMEGGRSEIDRAPGSLAVCAITSSGNDRRDRNCKRLTHDRCAEHCDASCEVPRTPVSPRVCALRNAKYVIQPDLNGGRRIIVDDHALASRRFSRRLSESVPLVIRSAAGCAVIVVAKIRRAASVASALGDLQP